MKRNKLTALLLSLTVLFTVSAMEKPDVPTIKIINKTGYDVTFEKVLQVDVDRGYPKSKRFDYVKPGGKQVYKLGVVVSLKASYIDLLRYKREVNLQESLDAAKRENADIELDLISGWVDPLYVEYKVAGAPEVKEIPKKEALVDEWIFKNESDSTVYGAWYELNYNSSRKANINPIIMKNAKFIQIEPGKQIPVPLPEREQYHVPFIGGRFGMSYQRQLLFSFNKNMLTPTITSNPDNSLPHGIINRSQYDFSSFGGEWKIYKHKKNGIPVLVPFNYLIQVNNTTNTPLYCAMYYVGKDGAKRYGSDIRIITKIDPQLNRLIQYPKNIDGKYRELFIISKKERLKSFLKPSEMDALYHKRFDESNIFEWYYNGSFNIITDPVSPFTISAESAGEGAIITALKSLAGIPVDISNFQGDVIETFEDGFAKKDPFYLPAKEILATDNNIVVKQAAQLKYENEFLQKRDKKVREALRKLLGKDSISDTDKVPKIALVFSGGGYRAMTEVTGFLRGAANEKQGGNILDCCHYMTGLSGSTWAINPFVLSKVSPQQFSDNLRQGLKLEAQTYTEKFVGSIASLVYNLVTSKNKEYLRQRFIEDMYNQYHGIIGLYGHSLARVLFSPYKGIIPGKNPHNITLSDLRAHLGNAEYPLPISVAVDTEGEGITAKYTWYEFSPYYIGTRAKQSNWKTDGTWVDTKFFGCAMKNDTIIHKVPEYPLAQYMGIWGSAFASSPKEIVKGKSAGLQAIASFAETLASTVAYGYNFLLSKKTKEIEEGSYRLDVGFIPNYNYNYNRAPQELTKKTMLSLVDGGLYNVDNLHRHNLATVPVLWRDAEVIIICDSRRSKKGKHDRLVHLKASSKEAKRLGLPFPTIDDTIIDRIDKEDVSLISEQGKPIIIYMRAKQNDGYDKSFNPDIADFTDTENFNYTPQNFDTLSGLTEHIFIEGKPAMRAALKEAIRRKNSPKGY